MSAAQVKQQLETFLQGGVGAIVVVDMKGEAVAWRHPDMADWTGTARIRQALTRVLHTAPELQHLSGFKP